MQNERSTQAHHLDSAMRTLSLEMESRSSTPAQACIISQQHFGAPAQTPCRMSNSLRCTRAMFVCTFLCNCCEQPEMRSPGRPQETGDWINPSNLNIHWHTNCCGFCQEIQSDIERHVFHIIVNPLSGRPAESQDPISKNVGTKYLSEVHGRWHDVQCPPYIPDNPSPNFDWEAGTLGVSTT
jgi:hypothetical protein